MSDSTSNLDTIAVGQSQKETTANALMNAESPASAFALRVVGTAGLTWAFYGGRIPVAGVSTSVANGTIALAASVTNYLELTAAGVVAVNSTAFTAGRLPLYTILTGAASITSWVDYRFVPIMVGHRFVRAMGDANQTLTQPQAACGIVECTGALTALRDVIVPLAAQQWTVFANVTGGFGVRIIGPTGAGITIADGKRAIVYSDGTNVVRCTADV